METRFDSQIVMFMLIAGSFAFMLSSNASKPPTLPHFQMATAFPTPFFFLQTETLSDFKVKTVSSLRLVQSPWLPELPSTVSMGHRKRMFFTHPHPTWARPLRHSFLPTDENILLPQIALSLRLVKTYRLPYCCSSRWSGVRKHFLTTTSPTPSLVMACQCLDQRRYQQQQRVIT